MISTRGDASASLDEAFLLGIAGDGGLFLPESLPAFSAAHFDDADDICGTAVTLLRPFFAGSMLSNQLAEIVTETFSFPIPVTPVAEKRGTFSLLELYHGPTAAFKDVGAGFLAACISRLNDSAERPLTILVATSGDTGGAVAAAFDGRAGTRVVVLFPEGRVSKRQQHQLCCWGDNVLSLSVKGSFDDCQAMVKAAMGDAGLAARHRFSSANSINIGRLLPQCIYYADTSLRHFRQGGRQASFVVPTGNLGNAFACIMAREMGLPIAEIVLATNANRTIADFLDGAEWTPRPSIATLASAMDVGNPSNMERLQKLAGDEARLRKMVRCVAVDDVQIENEIQRNYQEHGMIVCPHTATASWALQHLDPETRRANDWFVVATAHPAKFEQIVEPLIQKSVPLPGGLSDILSRPAVMTKVEPTLAALSDALEREFTT